VGASSVGGRDGPASFGFGIIEAFGGGAVEEERAVFN
jgi:hypothetical protein